MFHFAYNIVNRNQKISNIIIIIMSGWFGNKIRRGWKNILKITGCLPLGSGFLNRKWLSYYINVNRHTTKRERPDPLVLIFCYVFLSQLISIGVKEMLLFLKKFSLIEDHLKNLKLATRVNYHTLALKVYPSFFALIFDRIKIF